MSDTALELYIYMGSWDKVKEWLISQKVKTRDEAVNALSPHVQGLTYSVAASIGRGAGGSFAFAPGLVRVIDSFPEKKEVKKKVETKKKSTAKAK